MVFDVSAELSVLVTLSNRIPRTGDRVSRAEKAEVLHVSTDQAHTGPETKLYLRCIEAARA